MVEAGCRHPLLLLDPSEFVSRGGRDRNRRLTTMNVQSRRNSPLHRRCDTLAYATTTQPNKSFSVEVMVRPATRTCDLLVRSQAKRGNWGSWRQLLPGFLTDLTARDSRDHRRQARFVCRLSVELSSRVAFLGLALKWPLPFRCAWSDSTSRCSVSSPPHAEARNGLRSLASRAKASW
jgi:hypothetical protein